MSVKKAKEPQFSNCVSDFCRMVEGARTDYEWNREEVNRLDKLTQDYLHQLELEGLDYSERAKVATRLSRCRQLRRVSKDTVEVLEPLILFLDSEKGRDMMNLMRETLGKIRKVEERMKTRAYRYKVLERGDEVNG